MAILLRSTVPLGLLLDLYITVPAADSTELFIAGAWRAPADGATFEATSPATGERLGAVAEGGRADAAEAVAAAVSAFRGWSNETAFARARALHRVADACAARREELARAATLDQGKPVREALDEVDELIAMWRGAAEDGVRLEGAIPPSSAPGKRVLVLRRAVGPVAVVTPWNWPYTMPAELIAPALAVGNSVVWTPAPTTAHCSALLAECLVEADLPPGVFNFVTGPGPVVGDALVGHPDVAAVGFIGSTATGLRIAQRAAGKRLLLEMGGNGPLVVLDDADLEAAADAAVVGCFLCAGQSCTAAERILVHERVREEFVARLAARVESDVQLGDPRLAATVLGPLNNPGVASKMDEHVADAVARGARVVAGGQRAAGFPTDLYWPATILDGVPVQALAATEETFGPIAPIVSIDSLERAIELTNASPYGLLAAVFTADLARGLRFADEARTGLVNINETTNYWENHLPFGGRAGSLSGVGRVGGRYPFDALTDLQTVVIG
ncbi:MAG TPA: aldehyde dehydrogenase family protein [Solirubrobacteraceae bacterium]|nr:aldehyde dehydrogenase family protein [Solirubrobacteraceae bacterium]